MSYIRAQDEKRCRMTEDAQTDVEVQNTTIRCNQDAYPRADRTYLSTHVEGTATVVVGDNHGTLVTHHHHHYQAASIGSKNSRLLFESLSFGAMGARLRNVNPALSRTCRWLYDHEHFLSWIDHDRQQSSDDFLWLKGKPGSGKSTIMRNILLWVEKECPAYITLSYFFDARSPFHLAKSTLGLYRSVLYQLVSSCADIRNCFFNRFSAKVVTGAVETWTEEEIQNFLIDLTDAGHLPGFMLFIDALDESHNDDIQELVAFLEDLLQRASDSSVRLRVCFSSRHYPLISIDGNSIVLEDQPGHEEDINRYIRTRLLGGRQTGADELRYKLLNKAAGVFLWVALMVPRLNQRYNRGEGLAAMMEELERAPVKIQDLFIDLLTRDQDEMDACVTLLRCVLYAKRPLRPETLYRAVREAWCVGVGDAVSFNSDAICRYLLTCSRGLVEFTRSDNPTVQFIHETVRELLANNDLTHKSGDLRTFSMPLDFRAQVCHASMVEICLRCLFRSCEMQPGRHGQKRSQICDVGVFVLYAAEFWWQHMQETTGILRQPLLELASRLLTNDCTRNQWLDLYDIETILSRWRKRGVVGLFANCSPLYFATLAGIPELVREYVVSYNDVNGRVGSFDAALGAAACLGHEEIVQTLLEAGVNTDGGLLPYSPLLVAAGNNQKRLVAMLLASGAKIDRIMPQGTVLFEAVLQGHEEIVHLLLEHGADVNKYNSFFFSPIRQAIQDGRTSMIRLLLEHGADFRSDKTGQYLTDYVFEPYDKRGLERSWETNREMLKILLERGAGINPRTFDGHLEVLRENGDWELMSLLEKMRPRSENE